MDAARDCERVICIFGLDFNECRPAERPAGLLVLNYAVSVSVDAKNIAWLTAERTCSSV